MKSERKTSLKGIFCERCLQAVSVVISGDTNFTGFPLNAVIQRWPHIVNDLRDHEARCAFRQAP